MRLRRVDCLYKDHRRGMPVSDPGDETPERAVQFNESAPATIPGGWMFEETLRDIEAVLDTVVPGWRDLSDTHDEWRSLNLKGKESAE